MFTLEVRVIYVCAGTRVVIVQIIGSLRPSTGLRDKRIYLLASCAISQSSETADEKYGTGILLLPALLLAAAVIARWRWAVDSIDKNTK